VTLVSTPSRFARLTRLGALRAPEVGAAFWIAKGLSTALGESASDYLVNAMIPQIAVILGFLAFTAALVIQLCTGRYVAWTYWLTVVMVGIFGTMAAVAATFAMGTALGDFTAYTLHLGYPVSAALFAVLILIPALGYRRLGWNPILCFWSAYVITRPMGASIADWLAKPTQASGLGLGDGPVVAVLAGLILTVVAYLAITKTDVQRAPLAHSATDDQLPVKH